MCDDMLAVELGHAHNHVTVDCEHLANPDVFSVRGPSNA